MEELPPLFGPGQRLGRYELLHRLAVGGMAEVYLGYAKGPGDFRKVVAIKRLLPQNALDPQLLRMFLDEARLMARLSHPNVPQVIDVDDGGGVEVPFFVMEYVHGTDLRGVLNAAAGPLPFEQALTIASAIAAGLHHAHEQRGTGGLPLEIVHRDISPSNILISFDGGVKVTDFGVAKWTEQKSFTHQGQLKGKFAHMSPEQCRGETLDRRSDVFALGTLLYEMTTGHPPFVAESEYELLTQIVSRSASPPERKGETYPAALAAIVMRSLERTPDLRYPTTQQMQLEIEAFAREHRMVVSPVALGGYLEVLFGARVTEWRQAQKSGQTMVDLLERRADETNASRAGGSAAKERTATDAFIVNRQGQSPPRRSVPGRVLAIIAGAALSLALLLIATELTSRWQRVSGPPLAPLKPTEISPPTSMTVTAGDALPAARRPSPAIPTASRGTGALGEISTVTAAPAVRGESDAEAGARSARHERSTAGAGVAGVAARGRTGVPMAPASAGAPATSPQLSPQPSPPLAPAGQAEPATVGQAAGAQGPDPANPADAANSANPHSSKPVAPPPAPVKVWDPDSPVPP